MKKTLFRFLAILVAVLCFLWISKSIKHDKNSHAVDMIDFTKLLPEKYDKKNIISFEKYNIWGTNIVKGKDGLYHAIYSRWPKSRGHLAWVTHSEVAHAISKNLIGPYVFKDIVLPPHGGDYWDADVTHNPHLLTYKGKYYLYYMGNKGDGYWNATADSINPTPKNPEWWINRNNQRIGIAVASNINGPWKRCATPLIDVVPGRLMTSTPSVSVRKDGKFLMTYKYVEKSNKFKHGHVVHVTALSDSPEGPFIETGIPFITHPTSSFAIDDHVEWHDDEHYFCIAKDSRGVETDNPDGSMLLYIGDIKGLRWTLAKNPLVIKAGSIKWTDGTETKARRIADMPKLYVEDGSVKALIVSTLPTDTDDSFVRVIPIDF